MNLSGSESQENNKLKSANFPKKKGIRRWSFSVSSAWLQNKDKTLPPKTNGNSVGITKKKQPKRKECSSPVIPKKKPFLKLSASFSSGKSQVNKSVFYDCPPDSLSTFETELTDQENQSPNDPEFLRRASFRWKQRNGFSPKNVDGHSDSTVATVENSPLVGEALTPQMQPFTLESDFPNFSKPSSKVEGSSTNSMKPGSLTKSKMLNDNSAENRETGIRKKKLSIKNGSSMKFPKNLIMDDSVVDNVLKEAKKTKSSNAKVASLLNKFSIGHQQSKSSTLTHLGSCSSSPPSPKELNHSSKSYHCELYRCASSDSDVTQVSFEDIFLTEPAIAENFAIMFPTEPRPEWHRHLRQVLQKAGQKIFKKPEHHDTTIPENLRYQLKQIYVY